jgi:hypothetical protein
MALISEELPRVSRLLKQFKFCEPDLPVYATTNKIYIKRVGNHKESNILDGADLKEMIQRIAIPPQMPTESLLDFLRRIDREMKRGNTLDPKYQVPEKIIRFAIWVSEFVHYDAATIMEGIYQQSIIMGVDEACWFYLSLMPEIDKKLLIEKRKPELKEMQLLNG